MNDKNFIKTLTINAIVNEGFIIIELLALLIHRVVLSILLITYRPPSFYLSLHQKNKLIFPFKKPTHFFTKPLLLILV